jgi:hypothetical protein
MYWWERVLDIFTGCYSKARSLKSLRVADLGRSQIWEFVDTAWPPRGENVELQVRPLKIKDYDHLNGSLVVGAVFKGSDDREGPGAIIVTIDATRVEVKGVVLFRGAGSACFLVINGMLAELDRPQASQSELKTIDIFPCSYETWVPINGELTQIDGVISRNAPDNPTT